MADTASLQLSAVEIRDLREIAGTMIPADAALGVPGADDPAILADAVKSVGCDLALIREALAAISVKSDGVFADMDRDAREALIDAYCKMGGPAAAALGRLVASAYYRDDRVLIALGLEARAPFPKGHELEQGDWSLLDTVRKRAPFWRDDRAAAKE
ncbi:MAG: hypothetical protein JOY64_01930 [Alphaproteobacteria bacterium]|nr:hypothetical protein [Alphaproteobacteria bacterium]MBV8406361.1 hypothetical protein [Alphaproteobacteria bacterium]